MNPAILFKALQRRNKYRNSENRLNPPEAAIFSKSELLQSESYLKQIEKQGIRYTYPGESHYPMDFYKMIEPPLFIEFLGHPVWSSVEFMSVVGSRDCHDLTARWMDTQLLHFLKLENVGIVSGGARGVDIRAHSVSLRAQKPTIAILPSGLSCIYPTEFRSLVAPITENGGAVMTEFETDQKIHKSFFYFRNRLIAALGKVCLVTQAGLKSGTLLTVHHALQNGRPVATIPSHPLLVEFSGNLKLIHDGAAVIQNCVTLYDFWKAESWSGGMQI